MIEQVGDGSQVNRLAPVNVFDQAGDGNWYFSKPVNIKSLNFVLNIWHRTVNILRMFEPGISPTTSQMIVFVHRKNAGFDDWSARVRIEATSCTSTQWQSDTLLTCRISRGVGLNLTASSTVLRNYVAWPTCMSYNMPTFSTAFAPSLNSIKVFGSNFGSYHTVVPHTTICSNITISSNSSSFVCKSSALNLRGTGVAVTEAFVSVVFLDVSRLDDVIVSLWSPERVEYTLMQRKCFGALPCGTSTLMSFTFQIHPVALLEVPVEKCPSSGTYSPNSNDVNMLRLALLSNTAIGDWSLRVTAGSQILKVASASMFFKTATLDFEIGNSSVAALVWFSDSSVSMKAPGYQNSHGIDSSSGWGRNRSVGGFSSGLKLSSSCLYSYPDPSINNITGVAAYSASCSLKVMLIGRFFSNTDSTSRARVGISTCTITRWNSDTTVSCTRSPSLGSIRSFALTLDKSAVAAFNSSFVCFLAPIISGNITSMVAITASWLVSVVGKGFGAWDSSARLRLSRRHSSASTTLWTCDTHISAKVRIFYRDGPGAVISLASIVNNISSVQIPEGLSPKVSANTNPNIPSTGAAVIMSTGAGFGLYMASMRASIGSTDCQQSNWISDSFIHCKSSSGLGSSISISLAATFATAKITSGSVLVSYDVPVVNTSADIVVNNSIACFFDSSGCVPGRLFRLVYASSGFGTSVLPQLQLSVVQGSLPARNCDNTSWFSDSSMYCLFNAALSPEFSQLRVVVSTTGSQLSVKNPSYIQAAPRLNNETLKFRIYKNAKYPEGEDRGFREFGSTTDFILGESSFHDIVQHSEVVNFSVFALLDAPQYFLDANFLPIETSISSNITVWNASDVTSFITCDASSSKHILFSLPSRLFWGKFEASWAFCPPEEYFNMQLRVRATVCIQNSNGSLFLTSSSPAFIVNSTGAPAITFTKNPRTVMYAARLYDDDFGFRFYYGNNLDRMCESGGRSRFKYSVILICQLKASAFRRSVVTDGFIESTQCLQNITGIYFTKPLKNCVFNVSAGAGPIVYALSSEFDVVPGIALKIMLIGTGPNCASAGAIVWSVNSTIEGLCLVAQLMDAENNNVTSATNASVIARSVKSSHADYNLSRTTFSTSSDSGIIKWCDLYSGKQQNEGVVFGANVNRNIVYWNSSVINVSSAGPSMSIIPNISAVMNNQTLLPGAPPLKLAFSFQDAGGNPVTDLVGVAVRVRVVPLGSATMGRSVASILMTSGDNGRRLLQSVVSSAVSCDNVTSTELPLEFVFILNSRSSHGNLGPEFLCRSGHNDIFYDIGTVIGGAFVATFPSAFRTSVEVIPGHFQTFMLVPFSNAFSTRTYTLIDSLEVVFLDLGLNEVSGNATLTLATNGTVSMYPAKPCMVVATFGSKAYILPFFLFVSDWLPSQVPLLIGITAMKSSIPQYGSNILILWLHPTCSPGSFVAPSLDALLAQPNINHTMRCEVCKFPFYNSSFFDATQCFTLRWTFPDLPMIVTSGKPLTIANITVVNEAGMIISNTKGWKVNVSLVRAIHSAVSSGIEVEIENGTTRSRTLGAPMYADKPAIDYSWRLRVHVHSVDAVLTLMLPSNNNVRVLDVAPFVYKAVPESLSFAGSSVITLTAGFVSTVPTSKSAFAANLDLPSLRNDTCLFISRGVALPDIIVEANRSINSENTIEIICSEVRPALSGPPFTVWDAIMLLSDGRESSGNASLKSMCPLGYYIDSKVPPKPFECVRCPVGSTSLKENTNTTSPCICKEGYYGPPGKCTTCPKNVPGFKGCQSKGMLYPDIDAGYFIDYSKLGQCHETSQTCAAIMKCPNPKACPGQGNRQCLQTDEECYDDASFGCKQCCSSYYMENLKCHRCPQGQLPLLLGLALMALIIFVGISSSVEFPPALSVVAGMKVFITGMQSFVGIRLFDISWPPIVLRMFDFTRFFSFSIDVIRPECSISYNPDTKLASLLIGPFVCIAFVALMIAAYVLFKCRRISLALQHPTLQQLLIWPYQRVFKSVQSCIIVSALSLKFSGERLMCNGLLWNALNPSLMERANLLVLNQKVRRGAVVSGVSGNNFRTTSRIPTDWLALQSAVAPMSILEEFSRTARRFRLMVSSAMSIFFFTFQGNMEAALSTFDCSDGFLRKSPTVKCDVSDSMYVRMLAVSGIGIIVYTVVLPVGVMLTIRSRWARDVFIHDNLAYNHLVGFLTSVYRKEHRLWELVSCLRKVVLISIPMLVSKQPIVQSFAIFITMLMYTFCILYFKPMQNIFLNKLEVLGCISVLVGAFTSVFFVVEYEGRLLLSGSDKDFVGLVFVLVCAGALVLSVLLIYQDFARLLLMHRILFLKSWILDLSARLGAAATEGVYLSLVAAAFNKEASAEIYEFKRKMRIELENFKRKMSKSHGQISPILAVVHSWFFTLQLAFRARQYKPLPALVDKCVKAPELDTLVYLHKLSERVERWEQVSSDYWDVNPKELPKEFCEVNGDADPPHAEYAYQTNVIHMLEDALPARVHRILTGLMFSYFMCVARTEQTPAERE